MFKNCSKLIFDSHALLLKIFLNFEIHVQIPEINVPILKKLIHVKSYSLNMFHASSTSISCSMLFKSALSLSIISSTIFRLS